MENLSDASLNCFIKRLGGSLRHLHIRGVMLTDKSLQNLGNLTKLEKLTVYSAYGWPRGIRAIARFSNLKELSVSGAVELQGKDLVRAFCNRRLEKLVWLELSCCYKLTDAALMAVAKSCPNIKTLDLEGSGQFTDTSLVFVVNTCKFLTAINLSRVSRCFFNGAQATFCKLKR